MGATEDLGPWDAPWEDDSLAPAPIFSRQHRWARASLGCAALALVLCGAWWLVTAVTDSLLLIAAPAILSLLSAASAAVFALVGLSRGEAQAAVAALLSSVMAGLLILPTVGLFLLMLAVW